MILRIASLALALLLALAPLAAAQTPTEPAQGEQPPPATTPDEAGEDDEELGEEIPEDEEDEQGDDDGADPPADPGSGTGGSSGEPQEPSEPSTRERSRDGRLPRTGGDPIPLLVAGMAVLGSGLLLWSALGPPRRPHP
jgi:hypothetical protein